jgi:hypothetical protein
MNEACQFPSSPNKRSEPLGNFSQVFVEAITRSALAQDVKWRFLPTRTLSHWVIIG